MVKGGGKSFEVLATNHKKKDLLKNGSLFCDSIAATMIWYVFLSCRESAGEGGVFFFLWRTRSRCFFIEKYVLLMAIKKRDAAAQRAFLCRSGCWRNIALRAIWRQYGEGVCGVNQ